MKAVWLILGFCAAAGAQQNFDFRLLDRLGANAKSSTKVDLDRNMLQLAMKFMDREGDADLVRSIARKLDGIYVRTYEYDAPGKYNEADLAPLRSFLKGPGWNRIVESKDASDTTEIYAQPLPNDQLGGVAIITLSAREATVVYISGTMKMDDVAKLSGNMGVPKLKVPRELRDAPHDKPRED